MRSEVGYGVLFEACEDLQVLVLDEVADGLQFDPLDPGYIIWLLTFRSLKTMDALLLLADAGYGDQAMVLARMIYEDMVVAWWASAREGAALHELVKRYDMAAGTMLQQNFARREDIEVVQGRIVLTPAQIATFSEQEGFTLADARRLWTRKTTSDMVKSIRSQFSEDDAEVFDLLADVGFALTSSIVHNSPAAMGSTIAVTQKWAPGVSGAFATRSPARTFVHDALVFACHSFGLLARLVAEHQHDRVDAVLTKSRHATRFVPPDSAERNDTCPCESGFKYKKCHGR
jgi:hypothetical protein